MSETYDYEPDPRDFDPEPAWIANGGRWLFSLWPEEERLDVQWQPLYTAPPQQQAEPVAEKQRLQSKLFELAVSKGLITVHTKRLYDRNVNTTVSWMQGHTFRACDISNEAAHGIKEGT